MYVGGAITATNIYVNGYAVSTSTGGVAASGTGTTTTFVISNTTISTGTNSGALQVAGGVGVGGNMYVGGTVTGGGVRTTTTSTNPSNPTVGDLWYNTSNDVLYRYTYDGTNYYWIDTNGPNNGFFGLIAGTDIAVDLVTISNISTLQSVTSRGSSTSAAISITNTASSTSTNTGALRVSGGVGISGTLFVGNTTTITSTANSTSTTTGALVVTGGVGIGGALFVGNTTTITSTASSTSTTTGALVVTGGVGIGGNLAVGGTTILQQAQEVMVPVSSPGTNATLNFNSGAIFYITGMTSNFTATFVNVPTSTNYVMATSLILVQNATTAYVMNSVNVNGTTITPRYLGGSTATVTTSRTDILSITIIATGTNAYTVLATSGEYY
jgi:hypothetical protein